MILNNKDLIKKTFDPFRYNYNVEYESLKTNLQREVEYYVKDIKYGNYLLRKYFIIDIITLSEEKIKYIFDNFEELQELILSNYYYIEPYEYLYTNRYNFELIFLVDKNKKYDINKYSILYNMEYALKSFMTEEELETLLNQNITFKNLEKERLLKLKNKIIKLNHFNYIEGNNNTGKTKLLNEISNELCVPKFSLNNIDLNLESEITNMGSLKTIMYQLSGSYNIDQYSNYGKYIYRLSQILEFSKQYNNVVLLDDLRWSSLDNRNKVKLINTLSDYSYEYNPIVLTGYDERGLIKSKVYNPNIINLK